jgi:dUTP pyrophosphatase
MKIKLLATNAKAPVRANDCAAGYDLFSLYNYTLYPHQRLLVQTGIAMEIPDGYYGRIAPRSGWALKYGIDTLAGVIDSDYRGEVGVILYNTDKAIPFNIKMGDRIAQMIFKKYESIDFVIENELDQTERGSGGYGSSGN